jgi:hypothetical protein
MPLIERILPNRLKYAFLFHIDIDWIAAQVYAFYINGEFIYG